MDAASPPIRTPDHRIRVFVSSTLKELEPERRAARAAIERLQLAPVMFELGARPHPPRSLYRSYLDQSDIFVGIYGERYGWVAPDEDVSGLEDEYRLSGRLPALIYIKDPAPEREPRLKDLLDRVRSDDRTSYKSFTGPDDLGELIVGDLATLLAERFDASVDEAPGDHTIRREAIPAPYTAIVGREREKGDVLAMLDRPDVRLVTMVGPGGIGKSRLAIEIAQAAGDSGRPVAFALLESVVSPDRVMSAIARAIGVRDTGEEPLEQAVISSISDRDCLLVVDNMEHLLDASDQLVRLLTGAPRLHMLVTSRSPLRVRAERVYEIESLAVPVEGADADAAAQASAVSLFVERAAAVRPGFALTSSNAADVAGICRALDGIPLAIELAAARVRYLTPHEILARLDSSLLLLVDGARDLPARQRTLRGTIEWSARLLHDTGRAALSALSVFAGPFTIEAAEAVLAGIPELDPLSGLDALLDASLVQHRDRDGVPVFVLLSVVRAYAGEVATPESADAARRRWVEHYRAAGRAAAAGLRTASQLQQLDRIEAEAENYASVMRHLLGTRQLDTAAELAWSLYLYLWIGGLLGLVRTWMAELLDLRERDDLAVTQRTTAIALYYTRAIVFWQDPGVDVVPGLRRSAELFESTGDPAGGALARVSLGLALLTRPDGPDVAGAQGELEHALEGFRAGGDTWGEAMALVTLGRLDLAMGAVDSAHSRFDASYALASQQSERLGIVIAQNNRGWARLLAGDVAAADADFAEGLDMSLALEHDEGVAYGLEGLAAAQAARGDVHKAGLLLGTAATIRRRAGIANTAAFALYAPAVTAIREAGGGEVLDAGMAQGRSLSVAEVLDAVRG